MPQFPSPETVFESPASPADDAAACGEPDSSVYTDGGYLAQNPTWHVEDSPWKARQMLRMIRRNRLALCETGYEVVDWFYPPDDEPLGGKPLRQQILAVLRRGLYRLAPHRRIGRNVDQIGPVIGLQGVQEIAVASVLLVGNDPIQVHRAALRQGGGNLRFGLKADLLGLGTRYSVLRTRYSVLASRLVGKTRT